MIEPCMKNYVRPISETTDILTNQTLGIRSYECVLIEVRHENSDDMIEININNLLVEQGLAKYDPKTQHFIDVTFVPFECNSQLTNDDNDDDNDNNADGENESDAENWDHYNYVRPQIPKPIDTSTNILDTNGNILDFDVQFTEEDLKEAVSNLYKRYLSFCKKIIFFRKGGVYTRNNILLLFSSISLVIFVTLTFNTPPL